MLEQDSSLKSKVSHQFDPKTLEKFHDVMRSRDQRPHFSRPEISRFEASWTESIPGQIPDDIELYSHTSLKGLEKPKESLAQKKKRKKQERKLKGNREALELQRMEEHER